MTVGPVTSTIAAIAFVVDAGGLDQRQAQGLGLTEAPPAQIIRADFAELDEVSQRRLTFYASAILSNISEMALLERAGDTVAVERLMARTRQYASRMESSSLEYGLTRGEMLNFFLSKLSNELRGPLPRAILNADGQFVITSLFEAEEDVANTNTDDNGYIDLLRDTNIGGVDATN